MVKLGDATGFDPIFQVPPIKWGESQGMHVHEIRMRCIEAAVKAGIPAKLDQIQLLELARQFTDYVLGPTVDSGTDDEPARKPPEDEAARAHWDRSTRWSPDGGGAER